MAGIAEVPREIYEWELHLSGLLGSENGLRADTHKIPSKVVERSSVVVHRIAKDQSSGPKVGKLRDACDYLVALDLALYMEGPTLLVHSPVNLDLEVLDVSVCTATFGPTAFERPESRHA
jgi:hypothetical protein